MDTVSASDKESDVGEAIRFVLENRRVSIADILEYERILREREDASSKG